MMLNRRELLRDGSAVAAFCSLPIAFEPAAAAQATVASIVDDGLPLAAEMRAVLHRASTVVHEFTEDPGNLWMNTLEPMLRARPAAIAGYTSAPTLFCLQYLTRGYGLSLAACGVGAQAVATIVGVREGEATSRARATFLDLRDPQFLNSTPEVTWLLEPNRG
jgi:hypothetical protein